MMTQAISDFPPLKRCSAPHPLEADEDNLSLRPALPLKGKFAHLFFIPLGFLCKILQAGSRVPVIRDGVWQRLSRCNSRAVKHNVTQAALENCLCSPSPTRHRCHGRQSRNLPLQGAATEQRNSSFSLASSPLPSCHESP